MSQSRADDAGGFAPAAPRRLPVPAFVAIAVVAYAVTTALLWWPSAFLAIGVQAIGDKAGWWIGEPTSNDGEETFSTAIGAASSAVMFLIAAAVVWAFARKANVHAWPVVILATVVITAGYAVFWWGGFTGWW